MDIRLLELTILCLLSSLLGALALAFDYVFMGGIFAALSFGAVIMSGRRFS